MKKYLKKIILFTFSILLFSIFFNCYEEDYYWGNRLYKEKIEWFKKNNQDINTVFFGSSNMECHINPVLFDSIVAPTQEIQSFNLATRGSGNPESYYLYEKFIDSDASKNIKFAFLGLSPLGIRNSDALFNDRAIYSLSLKELLYTTLYTINGNHSLKTMGYRIGSFFVAYFYKVIRLSSIKKWLNSEDDELDSAANWPYVSLNIIASRGYFPLHNNETYRTSIDLDDEELQNYYLLKSKNLVKNQKRFLENISKSTCNKIHLKRVKELIEKSQKKGIKLYFVIPTTIYSNKEVYEIMGQLGDYVIDVSNINSFPEVYNFNNSFDLVHLNEKGAILNTRNLANSFIKRIK